MGINHALSKRRLPGVEEIAQRNLELDQRSADLDVREDSLKAQIREFHAQVQRAKEQLAAHGITLEINL